MTATTSVYANQGNGFGNNGMKEFKDIQGNWGMASIMRMQELGILEGYEDGTFRPDGLLKQDEAAVIIDRLVQKRLNLEAVDQDIDEDSDMVTGVPGWAKKSVLKGFKNNYINMKRYHSQVQCDRLLIVVELAKALGLEPVDPEDFDLNPFNFKDKNLISDEDYVYLLALFNAGYLKGYPDGNFNPNFLMSRVQMAKIVDNIFNGGGTDSSDKIAPVWPTNSAITASGITSSRVVLNWTAATDNVGVTLYKITYNDTTDKVKYANMSRTVTITGLSQDKEFTFTVYARDGAGNWSTSGPSVDATTLVSTKTTITAISVITGEARVGVELTAGTLTPTNAAATYQWLISDTVNGTYAAITGAAATRKYTPVDINAGKFIKVSATGTGDFTGTVTSEATSAVAISLAEIAAVAAINDAASTTQMALAIATYSAVLGLDLEDYDDLSDSDQDLVLGELIEHQDFLDKAEIKAAFDVAVAAQKLEE